MSDCHILERLGRDPARAVFSNFDNRTLISLTSETNIKHRVEDQMMMGREIGKEELQHPLAAGEVDFKWLCH